MKPLTTYTCKLLAEQASFLESWLRDQAYEFREVPYAQFAASKANTNLVFYASGKLVVQGKGTQEFVEFVLEPLVLREDGTHYEPIGWDTAFELIASKLNSRMLSESNAAD